jgi:hypothetical protein
MTSNERKQMEDIAELKVRQYFDHYLYQTLPATLDQAVASHNVDPSAHGGVERKFNRMVWLAMGLAASGGGTVGAMLATGFRTLVG